MTQRPTFTTTINGQYYRNVLLMEDLLHEIREFSEFYIFWQDGAPAHRVRETVARLTNETPGLIIPTLWPITAQI